jgi:predicted dehydrogenase
MRALIQGLGSIGRRHLRNLRTLVPECEIAVLRRASSVDPCPDVARRVSTVDEALDFEPEVAILAGPAPTHVPLAVQLVEHGAHVFIEKPLSDRLEGVDALIDLCAKRERVLMVGYVLRFVPAVERLRAELASGRAGRVLHLRLEVGQYLPDWRPGRDYRASVSARSSLGGGVLLELSHELDLARWLGGDARSVMARTARLGQLEIDVEDTAEVLLELVSGALASIHMDMLRRPARRTVEIVGERGVLSLDLLRDRLVWHDVDGRRQLLFVNRGRDRNSAYVRELDHFLDCARSGAMPQVSGDDGRAALALAVAARESARTHAAVSP